MKELADGKTCAISEGCCIAVWYPSVPLQTGLVASVHACSNCFLQSSGGAILSVPLIKMRLEHFSDTTEERPRREGLVSCQSLGQPDCPVSTAAHSALQPTRDPNRFRSYTASRSYGSLHPAWPYRSHRLQYHRHHLALAHLNLRAQRDCAHRLDEAKVRDHRYVALQGSCGRAPAGTRSHGPGSRLQPRGGPRSTARRPRP
jgi:hypothetical protein